MTLIDGSARHSSDNERKKLKNIQLETIAATTKKNHKLKKHIE